MRVENRSRRREGKAKTRHVSHGTKLVIALRFLFATITKWQSLGGKKK
jgi:hypothetical protein